MISSFSCWQDLDVVGIDNAVNVIEWTLAEMLNQREILEQAVEEIDRVVGKDRLVQESDVPKLNYVKACIRETLRLHPTNPFLVPHMARQDTTLAGYFVPKGIYVYISFIFLKLIRKIGCTYPLKHVFATLIVSIFLLFFSKLPLR